MTLNLTEILDRQAEAWLTARRSAASQPAADGTFFATLTNPDGTTETSPGFVLRSDLCLWLAANRDARACTTNILSEEYSTDGLGGAVRHVVAYEERGAAALEAMA